MTGQPFLALPSWDGGLLVAAASNDVVKVIEFACQPHTCTDQCRVQREEVLDRLAGGDVGGVSVDSALQLDDRGEPRFVDDVRDRFADWPRFIHALTVGDAA